MSRKPLNQCKDEAERREHWPELCRLADVVGRSKDPVGVCKAIAYICMRREDVKAHTEAHGESVNGFTNRAIDETMERDGGAAQ